MTEIKFFKNDAKRCKVILRNNKTYNYNVMCCAVGCKKQYLG